MTMRTYIPVALGWAARTRDSKVSYSGRYTSSVAEGPGTAGSQRNETSVQGQNIRIVDNVTTGKILSLGFEKRNQPAFLQDLSSHPVYHNATFCCYITY